MFEGEYASRFTRHVDALIAAAERGDPNGVRRPLKVLVSEVQMGTDQQAYGSERGGKGAGELW